jgi:hypothetical protein
LTELPASRQSMLCLLQSPCSVLNTHSVSELVHALVLLAGKQVKATFGTTKYCNAFLKGVPCGNPDCLYLHEVGEWTHLLQGTTTHTTS